MNLEQAIYEGALTAVGDPIFLGFLVFGFFLGFVVLQGQNLTGKMVILVPAGILALAFMPNWVSILFGLVCGGILYLAINKFITR
jgi:hypothetical protein